MLEKSGSSDPVIDRGMWGRSLDRGFLTPWRVFLALGGAPSSASLRLFALEREPEHPVAPPFVGRLSSLVNV